MPSQSSTIQPTRLRQIALVSSDIVRARKHLTEILDLPVVFIDPAVGQWGLENILVSIGGDIVEVVAPTKPGTTAGRLLDRRGEGGYMIIMQTEDAQARRKQVEAQGTSKVIFSHPFSNSYSSWNGVKDEGFCIQYHPKGIKGGMMPELDSHTPCERNERPLLNRFSPWHACGKDFERYTSLMKQTSDLHLLGCTLALGPDDQDTAGAVQQWSTIFSIPATGNQIAFTNARMGFVGGQEGTPEGLQTITVGVETKERLQDILERAQDAGLCDLSAQTIKMVGVRWHLVLLDAFQARL